MLLGGSGRGPVAGKLSPPGQKEGSDLYVKSYNRALPLSPWSCPKASLGDVLQPSGVRAFPAQSREWLEAALPQVADKPCMQTYHPQLISTMSSKQGPPRPATFPDSPVLPPHLPSCLSLLFWSLCLITLPFESFCLTATSPDHLRSSSRQGVEKLLNLETFWAQPSLQVQLASSYPLNWPHWCRPASRTASSHDTGCLGLCLFVLVWLKYAINWKVGSFS